MGRGNVGISHPRALKYVRRISAALVVFGVWTGTAGAGVAQASELDGWSCSLRLTATSDFSSTGSAECATPEGSIVSGTAALSLSAPQGRDCLGAPQEYAGTLQVAAVDGSGGSSPATLKVLSGQQLGTIHLGSGARGTVVLEDAQPDDPVERCVTSQPISWRALYGAFGPEPAAAYSAGDARLDRAAATVDQVLAESPVADPITNLRDVLTDGYSTVRGVKTAAGECAFTITSQLAPDEQSRSVRELAMNDELCLLRVLVTSAGEAETAESSASQSPDDPEPLTEITDALPDAVNCAISGERACVGRYKRSVATYKVYVRDPPNYPVNKVHQTLDFHYGNGCVHNPIEYDVWSWWLSQTGWSLKGKNNRFDASCGSTYVSSYRHFHNGIFCAGANTNTYYDRQVFLGHTNGSVTGSYTVRKKGLCKNLLHTEATITRP